MRQTSKEKKRRRRSRSREVTIISIVVIALIAALAVHTRTLQQTEDQLAARAAALEKQLEAESQRAEELEEKSIFVQTREYIEQIARERLGLVKPEDTVIRPDE